MSSLTLSDLILWELLKQKLFQFYFIKYKNVFYDRKVTSNIADLKMSFENL